MHLCTPLVLCTAHCCNSETKQLHCQVQLMHHGRNCHTNYVLLTLMSPCLFCCALCTHMPPNRLCDKKFVIVHCMHAYTCVQKIFSSTPIMHELIDQFEALHL